MSQPKRQHGHRWVVPTSAGGQPSPVSSTRSVPRVSGSRKQSSPPTTGALPKMAMGMARWYWTRRRISGAMIPATRADIEHSPTPVCLGEQGVAGGVGRAQHPWTTVGLTAAMGTARLLPHHCHQPWWREPLMCVETSPDDGGEELCRVDIGGGEGG